MLYDYQCKACGAVQLNVINKIADRRTNAPECCGEKMIIIITQAPYGYIDREVRYICPVTQKEVTTRKQRNEIMAREGLVDANDFKMTHQQRLAAKQKNDDEIAAIKAEVPDELKKTMKKEFKKKEEEFKRSL